MAPADYHFHRGFRPDQPWQTLGATATGQNADQYFGQPNLGARHRDAVMTSERMFKSAAQRKTVDGGNSGLGSAVQHIEAGARQYRARLAELTDIRPGYKTATGADQDHRLHIRIGIALVNGGDDALTHARPQCIDRWIVDGNYAHAVFNIKPHDFSFAHDCFLTLSFLILQVSDRYAHRPHETALISESQSQQEYCVSTPESRKTPARQPVYKWQPRAWAHAR